MTVSTKQLTPLGRYLRKLRIDQDINMKEMADTIGMSAAVLSAMELGNKNPPSVFVEQFPLSYQLSDSEKESFYDLVDRSRVNVKINLIGASDADREMVALFAKKYKGLNQSQKKQLLELIEI